MDQSTQTQIKLLESKLAESEKQKEKIQNDVSFL